MKVLAAVKRVVDFNVKVRVKADQSSVELANVKCSMNPRNADGFCRALPKHAAALCFTQAGRYR
ncbi:hypothetical protein SAMN06295900_105203 [Trinickia caryophylli]|uniref:Electron transfer flavoprotein beta subunit n=1 Tax=Trinickia caryophylli TaxID=28094 RepID=A0A1X7EDA1_TRICW|nr:hypothetical protein SAMN06295900_105203 [Trinickia caryophylli]